MVLDDSYYRACPGCSMPMDPVGDHVLCCAKLGLCARHDLRGLRCPLHRGGLGCRFRESPESLRPADVLVHGIDNSPLAVDFSVVHPLQPSANLAVRPGRLVRQAENQKVRARLPACRRLGCSFCPFVIEPTGKAKHLTQLITQKSALLDTHIFGEGLKTQGFHRSEKRI